MRARANVGPLRVQAIAGTHVVTLGFDYERSKMAGLLGFGVERIDHTEGARRWLTNRLRFANVKRSWASNYNPFQSFTWGDYRAKPAHSYTYVVHALEGTPGQELQPRHSVSLSIATEAPELHGVWFNRGVTASQAYAERFRNKHPTDVPNREAWRWLSRGLEEALLAFVGQAIDDSWEVHGALYEFEYPAVLRAFMVAADSGARVRLVVHDHDTNRHAAAAAGLDDQVVTWRRRASIPHNKFVVASHHGRPVAVWTGSTNITENGIFGQSNVGHEIRGETLAGKYLAYWDQLVADPTPGVLNDWVDAENPLPSRWSKGTTVVFSPHSALDALDRYAKLFASAKAMVCMTLPFNLDARFSSQLRGNFKALRWLLFENPAEARKHRDLVTDADTELVAGAVVPEGGLRGWVAEMENPLSSNIEFIHTKYLLVDPLGRDPIVVTGSANFSVSSTTKNDENMLVIRGNTGVADVYFTEFFRLFNHYRFRQHLGLEPTAPTPGPEANRVASLGLAADDSWWPRYFDEPARDKQRRVLAGSS